VSLPPEWLVPDWPAPRNVRAFVTTRAGGVSSGEYASMNLGAASGDDPARVERNRGIVAQHLPMAPRYMVQVHGSGVADLDIFRESDVPTADAAISSTPGRVAAVLVADCMPLFVADMKGGRVGIAHAGWRGMAAGVIENVVRNLGTPAADVVAWMGPAIGPAAFEVGPEVKEAFERFDPAASTAFTPGAPGKFMADLYALARQRLARAGVREVHGGGLCTYRDASRFFSYRRAPKSGRMGAFIWIE
jgi:YfiH family protein